MILRRAEIISREKANDLEVDMKEGRSMLLLSVASVCIRVSDRHRPCHVVRKKKLPSCCVTFKLSVERRRKLYSLVGECSIVCVLLVSMQVFM